MRHPAPAQFEGDGKQEKKSGAFVRGDVVNASRERDAAAPTSEPSPGGRLYNMTPKSEAGGAAHNAPVSPALSAMQPPVDEDVDRKPAPKKEKKSGKRLDDARSPSSFSRACDVCRPFMADSCCENGAGESMH